MFLQRNSLLTLEKFSFLQIKEGGQKIDQNQFQEGGSLLHCPLTFIDCFLEAVQRLYFGFDLVTQFPLQTLPLLLQAHRQICNSSLQVSHDLFASLLSLMAFRQVALIQELKVISLLVFFMLIPLHFPPHLHLLHPHLLLHLLRSQIQVNAFSFKLVVIIKHSYHPFVLNYFQLSFLYDL